MIIKFEVPGPVVGKGRPKFTSAGTFGRAYTPKKTVNYEVLVKELYYNAYRDLQLSGPIRACLIAYLKIPKSMPKYKRKLIKEGYLFPCKKPDLDNIAKSVLDALNKVAYDDDKDVVELHVYKYYGEREYLEIELVELE